MNLDLVPTRGRPRENTLLGVLDAPPVPFLTGRHGIAAGLKPGPAMGKILDECFEAQLEMFPAMFTPEMAEAISEYKDQACGWKVTGCGGGGYLLLISEREIPNTVKVTPCTTGN